MSAPESVKSVLLRHHLAASSGEVNPFSGARADTLGHSRVSCVPPALDLNQVVRRRALSDLDTEQFVDPVVGPVRRLQRHTQGQCLPVVSAQVAGPEHPAVCGVGRARDFGAARKVAILEALERFHGLHDRTGRPPLRGTFQEVCALNLGVTISPEHLGLYAPERTQAPGFPCRAFTPQDRLDWVQGWDVQRGSAALLPSEFVFYGDLPARPLVYESSNGCAVGSSYEEATYHGLLELIERDAALRWWAGRSPLKQLEANVRPGGEVALLTDVIQAQGYQLRLFDATTTIPAVAVVAAARGAGPALLFAFGAHPDPQQAAARALMELSSAVGWARHWTTAEQGRAAELAQDPEAARGLADHSLLYASAHAATRLEQRWLSTAQPVPWPQAANRPTIAALLACLEQPGAHLPEPQVLAVDQSSAALRAAGLVCVKVLARGLVPMYYGAALARSVPWTGWTDTSPHPFS